MEPLVIRVSRKRTVDAQEALILQAKKMKADPVVFTLFKTNEGGEEDEDLRGIPIIDYQRALPNLVPETSAAAVSGNGDKACNIPHGEASIYEEDPLAFIGDSAIGEVGDNNAALRPQQQQHDQILLNGQPMVVVRANRDPILDANSLVFDYYRMQPLPAGDTQQAAIYAAEIAVANSVCDDLFDVRFASKLEADLVNELESSDDESLPYEEGDEDSNAENNWRNDYPDEDSYDEDGDADAEVSGYNDGIREEGHWREDVFPEEQLRRRFERIGMNELGGDDVDYDFLNDSTDED